MAKTLPNYWLCRCKRVHEKSIHPSNNWCAICGGGHTNSPRAKAEVLVPWLRSRIKSEQAFLRRNPFCAAGPAGDALKVRILDWKKDLGILTAKK